MIIVRRAWRDIPDGSLIVGPSGRIWQVLGKFTDYSGRPYVSLFDPEQSDDEQATTSPHVDPSHEIETIMHDSTLERAVDILAGRFALERM